MTDAPNHNDLHLARQCLLSARDTLTQALFQVYPHAVNACVFSARDFLEQAASALGLHVSPGAEPAASGLGCHRCGRPYSLGPDLVVSDENWAKIDPPQGGFLCPNCMNDAFEALGAPYGSIEAAFTSGPFANKNWKKPSAEPAAQQPQGDLVRRARWAGQPVGKEKTLYWELADRIEALEAAAAQPDPAAPARQSASAASKDERRP